jgi:hypothetical protein
VIDVDVPSVGLQSRRKGTAWRANAAAIAVVLFAHCVVFVVILRGTVKGRAAPAAESAPLLIHFLDERPAESVGSPRPRSTTALPKRLHPLREPAKPAPADPHAAEFGDLQGVSVDWNAEMAAAANRARTQERTRSGQRPLDHVTPAVPPASAPSIFAPPPAHRAGTWDGPDRYYATDDCYYDFDRGPRVPANDLEHRLKTATCKAPPAGGGDEMFKGLTPEYLKAHPPTHKDP